MKNTLLFTLALLLGTGIFNSGKLYAQKNNSEIRITIREDGKVSSDISFFLDEDKELGFDLDSLKEAHGGSKVMVIKKEDGTVEVTELEGDCDEFTMLDDMDGHKVVRMEIKEEHTGPNSHSKMQKSSNHIMMFSDEDDCKGEKTIIIKTIGDDDKVEVTKHISVIVETDDNSDSKDKKTDKKKSDKE